MYGPQFTSDVNDLYLDWMNYKEPLLYEIFSKFLRVEASSSSSGHRQVSGYPYSVLVHISDADSDLAASLSVASRFGVPFHESIKVKEESDIHRLYLQHFAIETELRRIARMPYSTQQQQHPPGSLQRRAATITRNHRVEIGPVGDILSTSHPIHLHHRTYVDHRIHNASHDQGIISHPRRQAHSVSCLSIKSKVDPSRPRDCTAQPRRRCQLPNHYKRPLLSNMDIWQLYCLFDDMSYRDWVIQRANALQDNKSIDTRINNTTRRQLQILYLMTSLS